MAMCPYLGEDQEDKSKLNNHMVEFLNNLYGRTTERTNTTLPSFRLGDDDIFTIDYSNGDPIVATKRPFLLGVEKGRIIQLD